MTFIKLYTVMPVLLLNKMSLWCQEWLCRCFFFTCAKLFHPTKYKSCIWTWIYCFYLVSHAFSSFFPPPLFPLLLFANGGLHTEGTWFFVLVKIYQSQLISVVEIKWNKNSENLHSLLVHRQHFTLMWRGITMNQVWWCSYRNNVFLIEMEKCVFMDVCMHASM